MQGNDAPNRAQGSPPPTKADVHLTDASQDEGSRTSFWLDGDSVAL